MSETQWPAAVVKLFVKKSLKIKNKSREGGWRGIYRDRQADMYVHIIFQYISIIQWFLSSQNYAFNF